MHTRSRIDAESGTIYLDNPWGDHDLAISFHQYRQAFGTCQFVDLAMAEWIQWDPAMLREDGEFAMDSTLRRAVLGPLSGRARRAGLPRAFLQTCWQRAGDAEPSVMMSAPPSPALRMMKGSTCRIDSISVTITDLRETEDGTVIDGWIELDQGAAVGEGFR